MAKRAVWQRFPKESIFKKLAVSTCVVVLLPAVFLFVLFYQVYCGGLERSTREQFESALAQSAAAVDQLLRQVEEQTWQALSGLEGGVLTSPADYPMMARDMRRMEETVFSSSGIADILIVHANEGFLLSASSGYLSLNRGNYPKGLSFVSALSPRSGWLRYELWPENIYYFQKLPLYSVQEPAQATALVQVPQKLLCDALVLPRATYPGTQLVLLASDGVPLYADSMPDADTLAGWTQELRQGKGSGRFTGAEGQLCQYVRGERLWLIAVTQQRDLNAPLRAIRAYSVAILCSLSVLILVLALMYSTFVYRPLGRLWRYSVHLNGEAPARSSIDEYAYIRELLLRYDEERAALRQDLCAMAPVLRGEFIRMLLEGSQPENLKEALSDAGISETDQVVTLLVVLRRYAQNRQGTFPSAEEVRDRFSPLLEGIAQSFDLVKREAGKFCIVLYFPQGLDAEWVSDGAEEAARRLLRAVHESFQMNASIGIGAPAKSVASIADSYGQAAEALRRRFVQDGDIVAYRQVPLKPEREYYYPIQLEIQLIQAVRGGDEEACGRILEEVFERNANGSALDPNVANCLCFDLIGTVIKIMNDPVIKTQGVFDEHTLEHVFEGETFQEIYQSILGVLEGVCQNIRSGRGQPHRELIREVEEYIRAHYVENDLSQSWIAEKFGVSQSTLSISFKQSTGLSMVDYINRLRVEHAKQLLREQNARVADVSERSGFGNVKSMIRTFKRYEGMTPGQYRERTQPHTHNQGGSG